MADMKTVGRRHIEPELSATPSGAALAAGAAFSESIAAIAGGGSFIPKGVYRYKTHAEANEHEAACLAAGMAALALSRK
jgi:hypothetical protein